MIAITWDDSFLPALEEANFLHPVYGTWDLYAGNNQGDAGKGQKM